MTVPSSWEGLTVTGKSKDSSKTQRDEQADEFTFVVGGRPHPKGRPRMSRKGKVYTPEATVLAEKTYIAAVGEDAPTFDGPVTVEVTFCIDATLVTVTPLPHWETGLRGDLDNYIKTCLDGCQRAGIIVNDRQVGQVKATKE